jgi:transglutaminase-like putative cysteine protease/predicted glutamine amidotransferase
MRPACAIRVPHRAGLDVPALAVKARVLPRARRARGSRVSNDWHPVPSHHRGAIVGAPMPNLLAMSFEGELAPSFRLICLESGRQLPDGWGLGFYPGGEPSASVLKEPAPAAHSIRGDLVRAWEHLESSLFVLHIRSARWGAISDANTQPFVRSWGRRDWMICHSGSLDDRLAPEPGPFEAVGSTDTEQMFCSLLNRFVAKDWRSLMEADVAVLLDWLGDLDTKGEVTVCLTDGRDLLVYADRRGVPIHIGQLVPPYERAAFGDNDLAIDLTLRGAKSRKGLIVCSTPLAPIADGELPTAQIEWRPLTPGRLVVIRQGAIIAELGGDAPDPAPTPVLGHARLPRPQRAEPHTYDIVHRTSYVYERPVERSLHTFRLTPLHDRLQRVLEHDLSISVQGQSRDYDDVFGNRARRLAVEHPFSEMVIEARSKVQLLDVDPLDFRPLRSSATIPLVWMPWQRQVLEPYLLPPELPHTELSELVEYAQSFVRRNDSDVLDTLLDINSTIKREYAYVQGATTIATTPFEVYVNRNGVCQDFTNLFICLARLLGVPARYTCGYVYTGPKHENQVQSEASHAWVQVYLPEVGWKGFDPTNGILTQTEHIRVAVGRNYRDATPTAGTIYVGGGGETLTVDVHVTPS